MDLFGTKAKAYTWGIHLMVWLILFFMPFFFLYGASFEFKKLMEHFWLPLLYSAIIFYLNLFIFIDYFLFGSKVQISKYLLINLLLVLLFFGFHFELRQLVFYEQQPTFFTADGKLFTKQGPPVQLFVYKDLISFVIPIIFSIAVKSTERLVKSSAERSVIENEKLSAELRELKYRLQPHFFFNSMNNIYSLVDIAPDKAKETLHTLSKLMRYMLYETDHDKVDLAQEIEFLNKYIDLMRLRLTDKVSLKVNFPIINKPIKIAPFLFISLIENAFKHGVSATQESEITFDMEVDGGFIYFTSRNTNFFKKEDDMSGSGIGLENLRKRLVLMYPNKYTFNTSIHDGIFQTRLTIDL